MIRQYTYKYFQPDEYHFSLDSVEMPFWVANHFKNIDLSNSIVLDLCAGCGVVGFEFQFYKPEVKQIHFVEIQYEYQNYFEKNLEIVNKNNTEFIWHLLNYKELFTEKMKNKFDLILCNPPYFEITQGTLSPSQLKNRSRFYLDSDFTNLIAAMLYCLKTEAQAYFLLRPQQQHNKNILQELTSLVSNQAQVKIAADIRGTMLIEMKKYN